MLAMQKANVSFQAPVQVRNRMVGAPHDSMNLQALLPRTARLHFQLHLP